ncbi:MAG TPA: ABC transporter ATP-binding protein [Symbiobacteriaceae bacterium]|nr:ABC transporter ATP-binding protein [Symbiobacteriaceae bacterium]
MASPLLKVKDLVTGFWSEKGLLIAVDGVSFTIDEAETVCIVGESGCGKSVTSLSIMRLVDYDNGGILSGEVLLGGQDLAKLSQEEMRLIRGSQIAMVFQEPMTALNPVFTIGDQIAEAVILHEGSSKDEAWKRAVEMLSLVGIPEPESRAKQYPHEFSGGMRQRAMIAVALACNPRLLIADEPTTALDVTIQAQILDLLRHLQQKLKMSIVLITHDMGVAAEMADRIIVMYAGKIAEEGTVFELFDSPMHPYTMGLLASIPGYNSERGQRLHTIAGSTPNIAKMPSGCRFHPRCPYAVERCRTEEPVLHDLHGHDVACHRVDDVAAIRAANGKAVTEQ